MNRRQFGSVSLGAMFVSTFSKSNYAATGVQVTETRAKNYSKSEQYVRGSVISGDVFVTDLAGSEVSLRSILDETSKPLALIFIFGGGGLGHKRSLATGGIWCPDSYEDLHVLRTLADVFKKDVEFIPIACPPAFHTKMLGYDNSPFLHYEESHPDYIKAVKAFTDSTKQAFDNNIIPVEPFLDLRFRLLMSQQQQSGLPSGYGEIPSWQGKFRDVAETQTYGVPNFWMLDRNGLVLNEPYRGNIYHPHGGSLQINYTVKTIADDLERALASGGQHV